MSNQIEFRHLRYFQAVANELHFRKAAEKLFMSQPGLSRQVKQMEDELGIVLFERHNRKVKLTKSGEYLKHELENYFKSLEGIFHKAKLIQDGLIGELSFGYVGSAMQKVIPDLLIKFRKSYPNVLFDLKELENQDQIEGLLSEEIDVAFVRLDKIPGGLKKRDLLSEPFCLVLPKHHKVSKNSFESLNQFQSESFILFNQDYSSSYYDKIMRLFHDAGFTPNAMHNTIHSTSIFALVKNGFGLSIVPKSLTLEPVKGVKFIELNKVKQRTKLSMVWNPKNTNPLINNFLKLTL